MLLKTKGLEINLVNKIYAVITIALMLATAYRFVSYKSWERYNYTASVFAPETFPVYVREAYFILPDGDIEGLEHEAVNNFTSSWDTDYSSSDPIERQLLPKQLVLKYFSYRDAQFYRDTLDLPEQKMKRIFKIAAATKKDLVLSSYWGKIKGLTFVIGIANNGNLLVGLRGVYLEETLLKTRLKAKTPGKEDTYYAEPLSREAYFKTVFSRLSDSVKTQLNNGFDSGANYIDTPSRYIENNRKLWIYQKKNGFIE
ncbi:hypothetical protein ABIE26_001492 [Pedobacter africanus]|uniref:Uncharacterized protein n=1 Tax=Pedobacter africanus TaxID=151894 RepID=A0ACC6KRR3_9SPHI|nr:DUF2931 family protein [Pedobacter africanus]MDR6782019.1 hypothetical protein [Pedobacter africanus]